MDHKAFTDLVPGRLLSSACISPATLNEQSFIKAGDRSSPHLWHLLPAQFHLLGVNKISPVLGLAGHGPLSSYSSGDKSRVFPRNKYLGCQWYLYKVFFLCVYV